MATVDHDAVLLAIADPSRRERYAEWLADSVGVRSTTPGDDVDEQLDDDIAVVVVDAGFPSRRRVLEQAKRRPTPCRTILLAAEARTLDGMDQLCDTVLPTRTAVETLVTAVTQAFARREHERLASEYFAFAHQLAALENDGEVSIEQTSVTDRLNEIRQQLDTVCDQIDDEFTVLFGEFTPTTNHGTGDL